MFERDGRGRIVIPHGSWYRALSDALDTCESVPEGTRAASIRMRLSITARTEQYHRAYYTDGRQLSDTAIEQEGHVRVHEAIPPNEVIHLEGAYDVKALTLDALRDAFTTLGELIGLSPFGYNLGYGRFILEDMEHR